MLQLCWHILPGLWAPRANPHLILEAWAQKGPLDWPTWAQEGGHFPGKGFGPGFSFSSVTLPPVTIAKDLG